MANNDNIKKEMKKLQKNGKKDKVITEYEKLINDTELLLKESEKLLKNKFKKEDYIKDDRIKLFDKKNKTKKSAIMDSKEIKDLLQKAYIRKGIVKTSDVINKEYIKNIVYKKTEEYLSKNKEDEFEDDELDSEKCSKSHINSLPGDLRTNDLNVLKERKKEIESRVKEDTNRLRELEIEYDNEIASDKEFVDWWGDTRKEWKNHIDKFKKEDEPRRKEKIDIANNIDKIWDNIKNEVEGSKTQKENFELYGLDLKRLFTDTSVVQQKGYDVEKIVGSEESSLFLGGIGYMDNNGGDLPKINNAIKALNKLKGPDELNIIKDLLNKLKESPNKVKKDEAKYQVYQIIGFDKESGFDSFYKENKDSINQKYNENIKETNAIETRLNDYDGEWQLVDRKIKENS